MTQESYIRVLSVVTFELQYLEFLGGKKIVAVIWLYNYCGWHQIIWSLMNLMRKICWLGYIV